MTSFRDKLAAVRESIERAAVRSGRRGSDVTLVAVTKGATADAVREAYDAGLRIFGENRVQEASTKAPSLPPAEWHLIGHLQTNKVRAALPLFALVQSVDSLRLAEKLSGEAARLGRALEVLLEANVSGEAAKHGFVPEAMPEAFARASALPALAVRGVMGMAPLEGGEGAARRAFARLRAVSEALRPAGAAKWFLSMGMSGDLEAAIEEGSNMVRVGRALFA